MEVLLFAVVVGIISEVLWHNFSRAGKKQLTKYDKEHSTVTVLGTDELVSKLNESKGLGICDIKPDTNKVEFNCNKSCYTVNIEENRAYVDYDMSGFGVRLSTIGKIKKRVKFWKSAHNAMTVNAIMDNFQNDSSAQKEYKTNKIFAKAYLVSFLAFIVMLVAGVFAAINSISNEAVSDAKSMEFRDNVTYEQLINAYLTDAEWKAFNSDNDVAVVEINGVSVEGENICIQFFGDLGMGLSYRTLTLRYFEVDGTSIDPNEAMEYIYFYYYLN